MMPTARSRTVESWLVSQGKTSIAGPRRSRRADGRPSPMTGYWFISPLVDGNVGPLVGASVIAGRTDDLVVLPLLEDVGAPAGDAAGGENAGEQLGRDPHVVLQARRVEIDVAVLVDRLFNDLFELQRNVVPAGLFLFES